MWKIRNMSDFITEDRAQYETEEIKKLLWLELFPQFGEILINGIPLMHYSKKQLRETIPSVD